MNRVVLVVGVGVLLAGGCAPQTHTVSGRVQFADGKPLTHGSVDVERIGGPTGASGRVQPDGTFTIVGLPEGEYTVAISRAFASGESSGATSARSGNDPGPPPMLVHERFLSPRTSGVQVSVPSSDKVTIVVEK